MKVYDLAHRQEIEGSSEYDYKFVLNEVGKGQLVNELEKSNHCLHYQYVVFERREETGEILDHQNADEWLADYKKMWRATGGLQPGDIVANYYRKYPLYQVKKKTQKGYWVQPCNEDGETFGAVQKSVPWHTLAKY